MQAKESVTHGHNKDACLEPIDQQGTPLHDLPQRMSTKPQTNPSLEPLHNHHAMLNGALFL
jgi:hypothetical protein